MLQCKLALLDKAKWIAKEHSINNISIVMIVGKFKILRSGPNVSLYTITNAR